MFDKYEYEAIFAAYKRGLLVRTFMNSESADGMVYGANITLTGLRIICNYIRDVFGKCSILPEEAVHNLGTGYV